MSLKFLETKLKATKSRLEECEQEEKNLNRRLDFLLESSSDDAAREFRSEYLTKKDRFSDERIRLRKELSELERKYAELSESEFDYKQTLKSALQSKDCIKSNEWISLRESYRQLFEAIVIGPEDLKGTRKMRFILRDPGSNYSETDDYFYRGKVEDESCTRLKMVDQTGIEPATS